MDNEFFRPVSGFDLPRFAGIPTFFRLPHVPPGHPRFGDVEVAHCRPALGRGHHQSSRHAPRSARPARFNDDDTGLPPGYPLRPVRFRPLRRCRGCRPESGQSRQHARAGRGFLPGPRWPGNFTAHDRRRPSPLPSGSSRTPERAACAWHDPLRRSHRPVRVVFWRLSVHAWNAVPARHRRRFTGSEAMHSNRNPGHGLRLRGHRLGPGEGGPNYFRRRAVHPGGGGRNG